MALKTKSNAYTEYYLLLNFMKGVILAGGTGTRLFPLTRATNKHLLPVYDKPMIYYPIETLKKSGIRDILIVSNNQHVSNFMELLGSGRDFGVHFTYKVQDGAGGIADALALAEDFSAGDPIAMILSDNVFEADFTDEVLQFRSGAKIFVKSVKNPQFFGVVELDDAGVIHSFEEKPLLPKSNLVQTGFAIYDSEVFDIIRDLPPSDRGEMEITDVNRIFWEKGRLKASVIVGEWVDAGTHESLLEAGYLVKNNFDKTSIQKNVATTNQIKTQKVTIGIVTYNSEKYVDSFFPSLLAQTYKNLEILVFDNGSTDNTIQKIREKFPTVSVETSQKNFGFGAAHNRLIRKSSGDFYFCANIDMILESDCIEWLMKTITDRPVYGSAGGKIKRWDFEVFSKASNHFLENGKTNFLDSVGIRFLRSHRFEDIGQGEVDYGQYDSPQDLFGISGAAVLYRKKALDDVAWTNETGEKEYFDESMFMYKEDIDLAYRLQWAGWKSRYTPKAVCYHDRTTFQEGSSAWEIIKNRRKKSKVVNEHSYLNHLILLEKNFSDHFSLGIKNATEWYNMKVFFYLLFFEPSVLWQLWRAWKMRKSIQEKKSAIPKRVTEEQIEMLIN